MSPSASQATLEQRACDRLSRASANSQQTAYIVPTTTTLLALAKRLEASASASVVAPRSGEGKSTPTSLLSRVAVPRNAPKAVIVFSDQLLDPADATLFVRHDSGDGFFSPLEAILNIKYGYELDVWTGEGSAVIPGHAGTLESVLTCMVAHVRSCEVLGDLWRMRALQGMRTPAFRVYQAQRKLRFFRSSILNAYREDPSHPDLARLLVDAERLERSMKDVASTT